MTPNTAPKKLPYDLQHTPGGRFKAAGPEPVNSPSISLRLTDRQYQKLKAIAGKKKAQWIRDAIDMRLAVEEARLIAGELETLSPGKPGPPSKRRVRSKTEQT